MNISLISPLPLPLSVEQPELTKALVEDALQKFVKVLKLANANILSRKNPKLTRWLSGVCEKFGLRVDEKKHLYTALGAIATVCYILVHASNSSSDICDNMISVMKDVGTKYSKESADALHTAILMTPPVIFKQALVILSAEDRNGMDALVKESLLSVQKETKTLFSNIPTKGGRAIMFLKGLLFANALTTAMSSEDAPDVEIIWNSLGFRALSFKRRSPTKKDGHQVPKKAKKAHAVVVHANQPDIVLSHPVAVHANQSDIVTVQAHPVGFAFDKVVPTEFPLGHDFDRYLSDLDLLECDETEFESFFAQLGTEV